MDKKFSFKQLYRAENFPELKILVDVAEEQLEKGVPLEDVLIESLEFAVSQASFYQTSLIVKANKKVSEGLNELAYNKAWPNLGSAAEHALELEERSFKDRHGKCGKDIAALIKLRREFLNVSLADLDKVIKRSWVEENFPELVERLYGERLK